MGNSKKWPELNFSEIEPTLTTLHQWLQIVGKVRLRTMPWQNHSWHTTLYVTSKGYSTHSIPYKGTTFLIEFDFKAHQLQIECAHTQTVHMDLKSRSVASFYSELMEHLKAMGIEVKIHAAPNEMDPAIPFAQNTTISAYHPIAAETIWKAMQKVNAVFNQFRSGFIGKVSPVHLFWGAFDLAVTRFSGASAPLHPGGMPNMPLEVMQEAYSKEVSSAGFWLGSAQSPMPVFYAYAYPSDDLFGKQPVVPKEAFYNEEMGEFFLKYEDVQQSSNPDKMLLEFLQSTYEAATKIATWDRENLER